MIEEEKSGDSSSLKSEEIEEEQKGDCSSFESQEIEEEQKGDCSSFESQEIEEEQKGDRSIQSLERQIIEESSRPMTTYINYMNRMENERKRK